MTFPQVYFPDMESAKLMLKISNPNGGRLYVSTFCDLAYAVLFKYDPMINPKRWYLDPKPWYDEFYITQEEFDGAKIKCHEYGWCTIEFPIEFCHWDDWIERRGARQQVEDTAIEFGLHYQAEQKVKQARAKHVGSEQTNRQAAPDCYEYIYEDEPEKEGFNCPDYICKWGPDEEEFYQGFYYCNDGLTRYLSIIRQQSEHHDCRGCARACHIYNPAVPDQPIIVDDDFCG